MENQINDKKLFSILAKQMVANGEKSKLTPKEKFRLVIDAPDNVITINKEAFAELFKLSDTELNSSISAFISAFLRFQNQSLKHATRLGKESVI